MADRVYIAIEGPIGVGKTTLARMLQPEFGAEALLEIFEENPFLSDFYADRERFAFQTQIVFLLSRYRQQREAQRIAQRRSLIGDYIFAKDRLFARLNLHGDELETYERLHSALAERVAQPDLVLYLRADSNTLMERIATRDRPYERNMSREYIVALSQAYERFFATYQETRLLTVDTDELDVVRSPADLRDTVTGIRTALEQVPRDMSGRPQSQPQVPHHRAAAAAVVTGPSCSAEGQRASELYREFVELQKATGDLAGALLGAEGQGALRLALDACQASLRRLADRAGDIAAGPAPAEEYRD